MEASGSGLIEVHCQEVIVAAIALMMEQLSLKRRQTSTRLHSGMTQKTASFKKNTSRCRYSYLQFRKRFKLLLKLPAQYLNEKLRNYALLKLNPHNKLNVKKYSEYCIQLYRKKT
jgi:hypothetical protein